MSRRMEFGRSVTPEFSGTREERNLPEAFCCGESFIVFRTCAIKKEGYGRS